MLHKDYYAGRTPPKVHSKSKAWEDWWAEQVNRCMFGYQSPHQDYFITGWHYFMINFFRIELVDPKTGEVQVGLPYWSQEDDRLFKMIKEAEDSKKGFLFLTARGYGKSYATAVIIAHDYTFFPSAKMVISSSIEKPSKDLFDKMEFGLANLPAPLRHNRLINLKGEVIQSGMRYLENGEEKKKGFMSKASRMTYGDNPGKGRGDRLRRQIFEEIGAWTGSASLLDCYAMSEGCFIRGGIVTGQPIFIGTGGQMKSGATKHAKELYFNPETFNLYVASQDRNGRGKCHFIPAYKKFSGFYEFEGPVYDQVEKDQQIGYVTADGVSDEEGARAQLERRRKTKETNPAAYSQEIQEYPFNEQEMFTINGTNKFNQIKIARQAIALDNSKTRPTETGFLEWVRGGDHKIKGVRWIPDAEGTIEIVKGEEPRVDAHGQPYRNLYVAGLDSIDQGRGDSMGVDGSKLCLVVKKRFLAVEDTSDLYVCKYTDRPELAETAFDNVLKVLWWYNCRVNLEYSKISIVPFFKARKQYFRFVQRPAVALSDMNSTRFTSLIGTQMVPKIIQHMNLRLQMYVEESCDKILFRSTLTQLRDYDPDNQTEFDEVIAMGLCEIADEDMAELTAVAQRPPDEKISTGFGYYRDPATGHKVRGKLPQQGELMRELGFVRKPAVRFLDAQSQAAEYYPG